ncbi:hypothetical protein [Ereboglobus luteus]|uniref:IraD/Gp25-like domain-containing protein n=1 Tax=Ereboglobus luteus TaxID=1796921 RepID=A0A2U8E5V4_9BACT|nr:hypothetical protein [Ereboglobus luteus]AWI10319.1 hypothetical protein CKA38_14595 [Ereboglobus luteus]
MITRALQVTSDYRTNHDWTFGKGRQSYLRHEDAIKQSIKTRLMSFLGDCFFDINAGVDWWRFLGGKERLALLVQIRSIILGTEGVMGVTDLDVIDAPATRGIQIRYEINTLYSRTQTGTVEVSTSSVA